MSALLGGSLVLVFVWLLAGSIGAPLPEDAALLGTGVLIHRDLVEPVLAMVVVFVGVLGGDAILFFTARRLGPAAYQRKLFQKILPPERRARLEHAFERHGGKLVFAGRHVAGLRAAVFAMAGINGMRPRRFLFWDALAACITVPLTVAVGYAGSAHVDRVRAGVARFEHYVLAVVVIALLGLWSWHHVRLLHGDRAPSTPTHA